MVYVFVELLPADVLQNIKARQSPLSRQGALFSFHKGFLEKHAVLNEERSHLQNVRFDGCYIEVRKTKE